MSGLLECLFGLFFFLFLILLCMNARNAVFLDCQSWRNMRTGYCPHKLLLAQHCELSNNSSKTLFKLMPFSILKKSHGRVKSIFLPIDVYFLMYSVCPSPLESLNHREFLLETQILKKLRHRHLITLFAVCTSSIPFYIITELMEKGNLLSFLRG